MARPRWVGALAAKRLARKEKEQALDDAYFEWRLGEDEFGAAEWELRAACEEHERESGAEHPDTLTARLRLADLLAERGSFEDTEREYQAVLDVQRRNLGL